MSTTAQLTYSIPPPDGSRPFTNMNHDSFTGKRLHNWTKDTHYVQVEDVRGKEHRYTLDTAGFQFYRHPANHTRFLDDEEIKKEYYPENMELIKKLTGATRAVLFDHRRPDLVNDSPEKRQPVSFVHVDQTTSSAKARVPRHFPASDVPALLQRRYQIINLWRPISHSAIDWPLALCDFRSVNAEEDLMPISLIYPDHEGETLGVKYNPKHQWIYKSAMDPEDLVLFKCFDSIEDGSVARLTPHTAFEDPRTPEGTPFRESIEIRALVFY
ncbi:hypothetical protein V8B97DRAFT_1864287 [Scleroderma yunnanense]